MSSIRLRFVAIFFAASALLLCVFAQAKDISDVERAIEIIRTVDQKDPAAAVSKISEALVSIGLEPAYEEVVDALLERIVKDFGNPDVRFSMRLFDLIGEYVPNQYHGKLESIIGEFSSRRKKGVLPQEEEDLKIVLGAVHENSTPVVSLKQAKIFFEHKQIGIGPAVKNFRERMEKYLIGQPDVIDHFVKLRTRDLGYGVRTEVENLWLAGLSGAGSDTAVRAFINAIWGDDTAYEKHMMPIGPIASEFDYNMVMGSGTGYVGSDQFPPILDFLVTHSCGRYYKQASKNQRDEVVFRVLEAPNWKPSLDDPNCPQNAVLYLDKFHLWTKKYKELMVPSALDGWFTIRTPNGGLSRIYVPINIVIASHDGIELLTSRELNGQRFGDPLSFDEMMRKHGKITKEKIVSSILGANGGVNTRQTDDGRGTSSNITDKVDHYLMMRPLSETDLKIIADKMIHEKIRKLSRSRGDYSKLNVTYSNDVLDLIQQYDYVAEENANPLKSKVKDLFEAPLFQAIVDGKIKPESRRIYLSVKHNDNGTTSLDVRVDGATTEVAIDATKSKMKREPMSDEQLIELSKTGDKLNEVVVGQKDALMQIGEAIFLSEEGRDGVIEVKDAKLAARTFMLLGWTSVGKTETAKALAEIILKDRNAARIYEFTPGTTEYDIKKKILGVDDGHGGCIPSDFMKEFDRRDGRLIIVLDEVANIRDKALLNMLYDLLREPVVTTFCDKKPRVMSNVTILLTGNAGQEIMQDLPANLPDVVRRAAMKEAHAMMLMSPDVRRNVYEKYFSPAFLGRVGDERIFNYAPLDYLPAAELFQIKIKGALKDLLPKSGVRGWQVSFKNEAHYRQIINAFEEEGFEVREQGASIDRFVKEKFQGKLRALLLTNLVPSDSAVGIEFARVEPAANDNPMMPSQNNIVMTVNTVKGQFELKLTGRQVQKASPRLAEDIILTAFHEAGHALVTKVYMERFREPEYIKILPGVARIMEQWIYYAGVATSDEKVRMTMTLEGVLREIAVLMGGAAAEELITKGGISREGKSNDIERATRLAELAILKIGVLPEWGLRVDEKAQLSERDKNKLSKLVDGLLKDGYAMAKEAIMANPETFAEMGNQLARRGILVRAELQKIFRDTAVKIEGQHDIVKLAKANSGKFEHADPKSNARTRGLNFEFTDKFSILSEEEVFDLEGELASQRLAEIAKLKVDKAIPLGGVPPRGPRPPNDGIPVLTDVAGTKLPRLQTREVVIPTQCELDLGTR